MKKKIFIVMLVFVALFTFTGCGKKSSKKKDRTLKETADAFFIKDDNKYALFNKDGKKLTDFEFTYAGSMINGAAIVEKDSQKAIIGSNGKMVAPFGKYKYIYSKDGLYEVIDEQGNNFLINAKGKKIADLKNSELHTYINDENYSILLDKERGKYSVLDVDGNAIITFNALKDEDEEPTTNSADGYVSVYYNNHNYIIDMISGKKLLDFEAKEHYCVNVVSKDGKLMTLNSCVGSFQSQDVVKYRAISNGKLYDLSDKCDKVSLYNDKNFICSKDHKEYLLDSKFNVGIEINNVSYKDNEHYAKAHNGSFDGIDFYEKDKVVANVACRTMNKNGYNESGLFLLNTYYSKPCGTESGTYEFYNEKGEKAFDKSFARADNFDSNSFAVVSEDKENYYLIDTKGKKVSEDYDQIYSRNHYYEVRKDNLRGAINFKGELVVDAKYDDIWEYEYDGVVYLAYGNSKKYTLYNLDTKKEVTTFESKPSLNRDYISVSRNGKTEYYTYKGKLFYTSK